MKCVRFDPYKPKEGEEERYLSDKEAEDFARAIVSIKEKRSKEIKSKIEDEEYWENVRIDYHMPEDKLVTVEERLEWLGYSIVPEDETYEQQIDRVFGGRKYEDNIRK